MVEPGVERRLRISLAHVRRCPFVYAARHVEAQHGVPRGGGCALVGKRLLEGTLTEPALPGAKVYVAPVTYNDDVAGCRNRDLADGSPAGTI
jgi:hypothetical protein